MAARPPGQPGRLICLVRDFLRGVCVKLQRIKTTCERSFMFGYYTFCSLLLQKSVDQYPWYYKKGSISSRFSKKPNLPPGIAHKLENNYYVQRDLVFTIRDTYTVC